MSDDYTGLYEWDASPEPESVEVWNWRPGSPGGQGCGVMSVGQAETLNGIWSDVDCSSSTYVVCEKVPE